MPPEPPGVTFTGFDMEELGEIPQIGNISSNMFNGLFSGLLCPDTERECAYITAVGYDNMLHRFVDGKDDGVLLAKTAWAMNICDRSKRTCRHSGNAGVNLRP